MTPEGQGTRPLYRKIQFLLVLITYYQCSIQYVLSYYEGIMTLFRMYTLNYEYIYGNKIVSNIADPKPI